MTGAARFGWVRLDKWNDSGREGSASARPASSISERREEDAVDERVVSRRERRQRRLRPRGGRARRSVRRQVNVGRVVLEDLAARGEAMVLRDARGHRRAVDARRLHGRELHDVERLALAKFSPPATIVVPSGSAAATAPILALCGAVGSVFGLRFAPFRGTGAGFGSVVPFEHDSFKPSRSCLVNGSVTPR
jgi:hypothetical protein